MRNCLPGCDPMMMKNRATNEAAASADRRGANAGSTAQSEHAPGAAMADTSAGAATLQRYRQMASSSRHVLQLQQQAERMAVTQLSSAAVAGQVIQRMVSDDLTNGTSVKVIERDRQDFGRIGTITGKAVRIDGYFVQFNTGQTRDFLYEELVQVDQGVKADQGSASGLGARPKIDLERARYEHESSVPKIETDKDEVLEQWGGLNNPKFYGALRASLKIARDPGHLEHASETLKLDKLINSYGQHPQVKALIDKYVRVKAIKAKGASSGTGLDELFKTSETMKYVERSYRPSKKMAAVALYDGEEFDWMDAQQQMRLSTEFIVWAADLVGEIAGHTGTFQKEFAGKWMTKKQSLMHELRDDAISERSNPATAISEAIGIHLRLTANVAGFERELYKNEQAEKALLSSGYSVADSYDFLIVELGLHRDALKRYLKSFTSRAKTVGESSPMVARFGSSDYYPPSPMQGLDDDSMVNDKANIPGNPLPNLATQSRLNYVEQAKPIPRAPVNPALAFAHEKLKAHFTTPKATSIKAAAKRKAKPLLADEDSSSDEADAVMIKVYLEKVKELKSGQERQEIIDALEKGLALLVVGTQ